MLQHLAHRLCALTTSAHTGPCPAASQCTFLPLWILKVSLSARVTGQKCQRGRAHPPAALISWLTGIGVETTQLPVPQVERLLGASLMPEPSFPSRFQLQSPPVVPAQCVLYVTSPRPPGVSSGITFLINTSLASGSPSQGIQTKRQVNLFLRSLSLTHSLTVGQPLQSSCLKLAPQM